ncbi:hypothetical protein [Flavobacterium sp.]|uniref:hypothetical protein n=1 Tax=Flavobacterium sp. TaxID=239 RepID=UPI0040349245
MKRSIVFIPVFALGMFLVNSFAQKASRTEETISYATKAKSKNPGAANIILRSPDGGKTWQDISGTMPTAEQPVSFFVGGTDMYLHVNNAMYHSKSDLITPVWKKTDVPELKGAYSSPPTSIAFSRSGIVAYNYNGQMYQKAPTTEAWHPVHTNFKKYSMRSVFETSDGTLLAGYDSYGLYRSVDDGKNWKKVYENGLVTDITESGGVILAAGSGGILRSVDNGEHWQVVVSEGGVGIAVENIREGFAAIAYNTATGSRMVLISQDYGKTWQSIEKGLPPCSSISSIIQMGSYLVCGHPDGIFLSADMGKTWSRVHPGIKEGVFTIYAASNALYAVAGNTGC